MAAPRAWVRPTAIAALAAIALGVALWIATDWVSKSDVQADTWSIRGNGALIVPCVGFPAIVALGWIFIYRRINFLYEESRRGDARALFPAMIILPFALFGGLVLANATIPAWASQNLMARSDHSAVLLADGTVLVTGGTGDYSALATTALRDPGTGAWRSGPNLIAARSGHASIALPDGRVLVAGGCCASNGSPRDQVWKPGDAAWTLLPPPGLGRTGHRILNLPDGAAIAHGGEAHADAERPMRFDPRDSTWAPVANMLAPRPGVSIGLLADGRVLAAGNLSLTEMRNAEIYDPAQDLWRATSGPGATWPNPIIAGLPDGRALVLTGHAHLEQWVGRAAIYDPRADAWHEVTGPATARQGASVTVLPDGRVVVLGGLVIEGAPLRSRPLASGEIFDGRTASWRGTAEMHEPRGSHSATLLADGRILVVGGFGVRGPLNSAELYDPTRDRWEPAGALGR